MSGSHPAALLASSRAFADRLKLPARGAAWAFFMLGFSITAGVNPVPNYDYSHYGGLTAQLTCAILAFLYLTFVFASRFVLPNMVKADYYTEMAPAVRFGLDLTVSMIAFVGAVSGASTINEVCPLEVEALCYRCPAKPNFAPNVPDECKLPVGSTSVIPFDCPSSCPEAFKLTIANGAYDGTAAGAYQFASVCMFFGVIAMMLVSVCTFAETQKGGSGYDDFDDIGASEYNAYAGESGTPNNESGIAYTTADAPVNSHDL
eukprot:g4217.t1